MSHQHGEDCLARFPVITEAPNHTTTRHCAVESRMKNLPTDGLLLSPDLQMRAALDTETISEYAAAMKAGEAFPPIRVIEADDGWLVCDGFHRVSAARAAGIASLPCNVTVGTMDDALLLALQANATNGLRRSNADKRRAVSVALARWPEKSDRVIAQLCGVNHEMVKPLRPQVAESATSSGAPAKRQGADGKQYPAANKPAAKPAQQPDPESFGPDDAEIAASLAAEEADRRAMELLLASDDKLATAYTEIKRLNAELAVVKGQRDAYMNRSAELLRQIGAMKREARRAA